jgi:hypothetical protein
MKKTYAFILVVSILFILVSSNFFCETKPPPPPLVKKIELKIGKIQISEDRGSHRELYGHIIRVEIFNLGDTDVTKYEVALNWNCPREPPNIIRGPGIFKKPGTIKAGKKIWAEVQYAGFIDCSSTPITVHGTCYVINQSSIPETDTVNNEKDFAYYVSSNP